MDESSAADWIARISTDVREQTHAIKTADEAQIFVDEVVNLVGEPPIRVEVIDRERAKALGHSSPDWKRDRVAGEAFSVEGSRVIYIIDAGEQPLTRGLLLFHEITDVLAPTPEAPHGPEFVRAWLDLMRRSPFYELAAGSMESALRVYGVPIGDTASRLASPQN